MSERKFQRFMMWHAAIAIVDGKAGRSVKVPVEVLRVGANAPSATTFGVFDSRVRVKRLDNSMVTCVCPWNLR